MNTQFEIREIALEQIHVDAAIQPRGSVDEALVKEYAQAVRDGAQFPLIVVFHDGERCILASGFHRFRSHQQAGYSEIRCCIYNGTWHDAWVYARGANKHGKHLTNEEKRRLVEEMLTDETTGQWSDAHIANHIGVSQPFVSKIRGSLSYNVIGYGQRMVQRGSQSYMMKTGSISQSIDGIIKEPTERVQQEFEKMLDACIEIGKELFILKHEASDAEFSTVAELEYGPLATDGSTAMDIVDRYVALADAAIRGVPREGLWRLYEDGKFSNHLMHFASQVFVETTANTPTS